MLHETVKMAWIRIHILVVLVCVGITCGSPFTTSQPDSEEDNNKCAPDIYCPGTNFPRKYSFKGRQITCDNMPQPKDNCCLPQEKHIVCFNILVDGQHLNFDQTNPAKATDFYALCESVVKAMGKEAGDYAKVTLDDSHGGYIHFNYGDFGEIKFRSSKHIKDLACGLAGEWPGKPMSRAFKTTSVPTTTTTTTSKAKKQPQPDVQSQN